MRTFGKKNIQVEYISGLYCDMCGADCSTFKDVIPENCATLQADWGYVSKSDGTRFEIHLCEECFYNVLEHIRNERRKVLGCFDYPHENDPLYGENNE